MEDDILSGVDTKGPAGIDATELYASLDLSLLVRNSNVTTKSSELTGPTDGTEENMTTVSYTHLTLPTIRLV